MLKWIMRPWDWLQAQAPHVVARVRAAIFFLALLGVKEAHDISEAIFWPDSEKWISRAFALCAGIALLLRAGDKTPEEVKALAKSLPPVDMTHRS